MLAFGDDVDTNMQQGQFSAGWLKFTVHMHLPNGEDALSIVSLDLFEFFNHRIDALVLVVVVNKNG